MEKAIHESSDKEHILLTSLGTRVYENTTYEWKGKTATADLTPLALLELLEELGMYMSNRVVAVVTQGAKNTTWPVFQEGVRTYLKTEAEPISIPDGRTSNEIREILESVANKIPEGADLTLDVTQGFRHSPLSFTLWCSILHRSAA